MCTFIVLKKTPKCDFETEPEADLFLQFHFFVAVTEQTEQDFVCIVLFHLFPILGGRVKIITDKTHKS